MEQIIPIKENGEVKIWQVISEPGDCTYYDFIMVQNFDEFTFAPFASTFRFPQRINRYEIVENMAEEDKEKVIHQLAEREHCNPHTVKECIRIISLVL